MWYEEDEEAEEEGNRVVWNFKLIKREETRSVYGRKASEVKMKLTELKENQIKNRRNGFQIAEM